MNEETKFLLDAARGEWAFLFDAETLKRVRSEQRRRREPGGVYGLETPLYDAIYGATAADVRQLVGAPVGYAVADELAQAINRYYSPRCVKLALNKARDDFQRLWRSRRPKERTPRQADRVAKLILLWIRINTFQLEWPDYRNPIIFEIKERPSLRRRVN